MDKVFSGDKKSSFKKIKNKRWLTKSLPSYIFKHFNYTCDPKKIKKYGFKNKYK